jgi:hypothetical protein
MKKPVRLEINNSGAWKVLGKFDAADDFQADDILNAAERLASVLAESGNRLTMRVSMAQPPHAPVMHWTDAEAGWRDAKGQAA